MSALAYAQEPDGMGGYRHVLRDAAAMPAARTGGRRRKIIVPDPIQASAEGSAQQLKLLIERAECIQAEIAEVQADLADVFAEAKGRGFDAPTMKAIMARRKREGHVNDEADALLETYRAALGL